MIHNGPRAAIICRPRVMSRLFAVVQGQTSRGRAIMNPQRDLRVVLLKAAAIVAALLSPFAFAVLARTQSVAASFITGIVRGERGPEAGVWVIAETNELATRLVKIVVTDEAGRFLLPDLPRT